MRAPRRRSPALASLVVPVNRAADGMRLWLGAAAVLAATGGRFGRRAAMRGLLAAGIASGLANGPVKLLSRRRRPPLAALSSRLPGLPTTRTSSFPSSHSAAAFAFAVGAAQEVPAGALPLGGLAALVAYARVHAGVHYPTDVIAGSALGSGVALATRRLWPVAPRSAADARQAVPSRSSVEPSSRGEGLTVVVNPSAGYGTTETDTLRNVLPDVEVVEVDDPAQLLETLEKAAAGARAIGVMGGDGSVASAAAVAAAHGIPLLVIPGGTLNHFAAALGVGTVQDAAEAVQAGEVAGIDRATIAGETFVNTASLGSYVELVDARERLEGRIGKWPAVVVALGRILRRSEPIEIEIDGRPTRAWMVFIGNCRYHPDGFAPSWRERLDDGRLDIRVVDADRPLARARLLLAVLTGRLARCGVYRQWYAPRMTVRSRQGPLRLARDGETFDGPAEFSVEKADQPLCVYVPAR